MDSPAGREYQVIQVRVGLVAILAIRASVDLAASQAKTEIVDIPALVDLAVLAELTAIADIPVLVDLVVQELVDIQASAVTADRAWATQAIQATAECQG